MSGRAYYNEHDKFAAAWLRELVKRGLIADGDVDERDIQEVKGNDLDGYCQVHFFAGIGGWSYALRLAGWGDDRPVWTGSCPCQPFSGIGKGAGTSDERHLWPSMFALIEQCRPLVCLGEQVASPDGLEWIDGVFADLEGAGYSAWAADMCAAGVGAPHIRQRLYWVGDTQRPRLEGHGGNVAAGGGKEAAGPDTTPGCGDTVCSGVDALPVLRRVAMHDPRRACSRLPVPAAGGMDERPLWADFDALPCSDGWRRVRPGSFPLAHGVPARVGRLRGYGNAIVPQVAATFIKAYMECASEVSA